MKTKTLPEQLAEAEAAIRALQDELADTNRGLVALSMELDERVEERTTELARSNTALRAEIAERQRVEEALRASAADWERTFNSVPDCVAILDVEHRIVRANRAMAERLGLTTAQCAGLRCYEAVHGTTQPPDFCPHTHTCRDRRENTAEVHEPRLGGDFLVSTTPRLDEQGRLMGAVHVARDITGRKRAEERTRLLSEVTARLLSSDQPQQIVESLCRKVMARLLQFPGGRAGRPPAPQRLRRHTGRGGPQDRVARLWRGGVRLRGAGRPPHRGGARSDHARPPHRSGPRFRHPGVRLPPALEPGPGHRDAFVRLADEARVWRG
jgi:PAS domain S-box-containing protein